jgi:hypothetical protein
MPMNHRLLRPKRRRSSAPPPVDAEPSLTVTVQGADPVEPTPGEKEEFSVGGGENVTVAIGDGIVDDGGVSWDETGTIATSQAPTGYEEITNTGSSVTFRALEEGARPDCFIIGETPPGVSFSIDVQGVDSDPGSPGAAEVVVISFDGATGGTITFQILSIGATDPLPFDVTAEDFETALESATGLGWTVTGADGEFTVTAEEAGVRDDLEIFGHDLTKPAS